MGGSNKVGWGGVVIEGGGIRAGQGFWRRLIVVVTSGCLFPFPADIISLV